MLKKSTSSPPSTNSSSSSRPPQRHVSHPWGRLLPARLSSATAATMDRSPSGHQQEESLRMEHWLDEHPDFAHDYFVRKATTSMIDGWCLNQTVSQSLMQSGGNIPVSDAQSTASSSRQNSGANTPVRRISAQEFERGGQTLERMVSDVNGTLSFLGASQRFAAASSKTRRSRAELQALDERELLYELVLNICNDLDVTSLCHKILQNVSLLLNADRCSLFLLEGEGSEEQCVVSKLFDVSANASLDACTVDEVRVPWGTGIVGNVAQTGQALNIPDAYKDSRFNVEVDLKTGYTTRNILCMPILDAEGKVIGVSQAINKISSRGRGDEAFSEHDEKVFDSYLAFCGIGLRNAQLYERSLLENRRNQLLLDLARVIFEEQSNVAGLIHKIMTHTQSLLQCERCQVLLVEDDLATQGVFSQVFDFGANDSKEENGCHLSCHPDQRFPLNIGITGHVAESGVTLNIPDAYQDDRFDPKVDEDTGFKTQSILCMPIRNATGSIIGVAQLINKLDGTPFNNNDQYILEAFIIFCGMGIHNTQMYEKAVKAMAKQSIALEVLSYHAAAPSEEVHRLKKMAVPSVEHFQLYDYKFSDFVFDDDETIKAGIRMFLDLNLLETFSIGYEVFCRWILSVKKNYRNVTYHNWRHAFNVTQTMFVMIKQGQLQNIFGDEEVLALMVACLCHDLDHRGTNNQFQIQSESPLAQLYSTSTLEHHHFDQCLMILNTKGSEIFGQLNKKQYSRVIRILENAILATDLALYFRFRSEFFTIIDSGQAAWNTETDKDLLRSMMMTACDVAAITKPWKVQQKVANLIANEFFEQGDLEKHQLHIRPIDMMDREKKDELPTMQVKFIDSICMPVYQAFARLDTKFAPLLDGCQSNRDNWKRMQEGPIKITHEEQVRENAHKDSQESMRKKGSSGQLMQWVLSCVRKSSEER